MDINTLMVIFAVSIGLLIALKLLEMRFGERADYESRNSLLTPAERSFLGTLEQALDSRYRVFGKVCLGNLIKPVKGLDVGRWTTAQNRINQQYVDFVICTANELALVGVLALDDQSHGHEDRAGRDGFVDQVLSIAGIPVLCFAAQKEYSVQDMRVRLAEMISGTAKPGVVSGAQKAFTAFNPTLDAIMESNPVPTDSGAPGCPKCSAVMVKRHTERGQNAGRYFWACSTFPMCSQVMEIGE